MDTFLYEIAAPFAASNKIPRVFVSVIKQETEKAVKVKGMVSLDSSRNWHICPFCCKKLIPNSLEEKIGLCRKCGTFFGTFSLPGKSLIKAKAEKIKVEQWIPKKAIVRKKKISLVLVTPKEEKEIIKQRQEKVNRAKYVVTEKTAHLLLDKIVVKFPYKKETVTFMKTLPGREFHSKTMHWTVLCSKTNIALLKKEGFSLGPSLTTIENSKQCTSYDTVDINSLEPLPVPSSLRPLYPYQAVGAHFLEIKQGRGLIADDMGLGKTIQALSYAANHPEKVPVLIICPASLKYNWENEILATIPNPNIQILSGRKQVPISGDFIIINYDILSYWVSSLQRLFPKIIITDECHRYKNPKTKRTKAVKAVSKGVQSIIALSGTPIENRPVEFFTVLNLIAPSLFPKYMPYVYRYCNAKKGYWGLDVSGSSNMEELHDKINGVVMIRRLKKDVLKDLPPKIYTFLPLEISNSKEYELAEKHFIEYLGNSIEKAAEERDKKLQADIGTVMSNHGVSAYDKDIHAMTKEELDSLKRLKIAKASAAMHLTQLEVLKQVAVKGKLPQVISWVDDFLASGEKIVLFATHTFVIDALMSHFGKIAVKIDGSTPVRKRADIVDQFQTNKKITVFVGNIKAAGEGITLTSAYNVGMVEYPWTPGALTQCADRCHRIGQKDTVNIHYFLAVGTIEEKIVRSLDKKAQILNSILNGKGAPPIPLISELLEEYTKKINLS